MLYDRIKQIYEEPTQEAHAAFAEEFRELVENRRWVAFPAESDEHGSRYGTVPYGGQYWFAMFSHDSPAACATALEKCGFTDLGVTDINNLIDAVFAFPDCPGILIDPQGPRIMVLTRESLAFLAGRRDPWED